MAAFAFAIKASALLAAPEKTDKKPPVAIEAAEKVALPVPRFVTLGTDEVNLRTGPGLRYPIRTVVRKEGLPVEVIREYDVWRQLRDAEGDEGWAHKSMLSGKRSVIVKGQMQPLLKSPDKQSAPVARLEPGVVAELETCADDWCEVSVAQFKGWASRRALWGVYPEEKFEK